MKKIGFLWMMVSALFWGCNDQKDIDTTTGMTGKGSQLKVFSSCGEIGAIASPIIYNRSFVEEGSYAGPVYFSCNWEETVKENPDVFFGQTFIRARKDLVNVTPEDILEISGSERIQDPRLEKAVYENIMITKNLNGDNSAFSYVLYIWKAEDKEGNSETERVIMSNLSWGEPPVPPNDKTVVDMFLSMLEPTK